MFCKAWTAAGCSAQYASSGVILANSDAEGMVPPNGLAAGTTAASLADDAAAADASTAAVDAADDATVVAAVAVAVAAVAVVDAGVSLRFVTVTVNWLAPPVVCACPS